MVKVANVATVESLAKHFSTFYPCRFSTSNFCTCEPCQPCTFTSPKLEQDCFLSDSKCFLLVARGSRRSLLSGIDAWTQDKKETRTHTYTYVYLHVHTWIHPYVNLVQALSSLHAPVSSCYMNLHSTILVVRGKRERGNERENLGEVSGRISFSRNRDATIFLGLASDLDQHSSIRLTS